MRNIVRLLTWGAAACLLGCGGTTQQLSPELRRAAAGVRLIDGPPPSGSKLVGQVEYLSCARQLGSSPDMGAAREQLKFKAARLHANAVAAIACQEEGVSLADNCWKSIRCMGDAIALE
jgi:hypothetical protein